MVDNQTDNFTLQVFDSLLKFALYIPSRPVRYITRGCDVHMNHRWLRCDIASWQIKYDKDTARDCHERVMSHSCKCSGTTATSCCYSATKVCLGSLPSPVTTTLNSLILPRYVLISILLIIISVNLLWTLNQWQSPTQYSTRDKMPNKCLIQTQQNPGIVKSDLSLFYKYIRDKY